MSSQTRYFRLGLFLIIGGGLIVAAAIVFGTASLIAETVPAETYFAESIEGLDQGSPVKFRGVQIGQVAEVGFVSEKYSTVAGRQGQYVLVRMDIDKDVLQGLDVSSFDRSVKGFVDEGLRARLTTQGLTGVSYLEINYQDPERNPVPLINWEPDVLYIPSAPSTMGRLEDAILNISKTLENIASIDFAQLVKSIDSILAQIDKSIEDANVASLGQLLAQNLDESRKLLARTNQLVGAPEAETILPDAAASMASLRRLTEAAEGDVAEVLAALVGTLLDIDEAGRALRDVLTDPALRKGLGQMPEILENVRQASSAFGKSADRLNSLLSNMDETVMQERGDLEAILANLRSLTDNLDRLAAEAADNPSRVILGEPPRQGFPATRTSEEQ